MDWPARSSPPPATGGLPVSTHERFMGNLVTATALQLSDLFSQLTK
ncbi:hypothetical protein LT679_00510 [Mucilaginibacter roseus]|uniref:Uncharacterized protein n=1 Tax=Mucilaginibacter roseus TaxID=1528868 RepID=A0ABS8TZP1_9SPHI|nr:hypothetical protein [Mucilaginibacter roseus]MCD8739067.1 hypothetical protein [Mucilaginibacter roseus]